MIEKLINEVKNEFSNKSTIFMLGIIIGMLAGYVETWWVFLR